LVLEPQEVLYAVKACAHIITQGLDKEIYCRLDEWRKLMDAWKTRGSAMTVREFEEEGDDADCVCFRVAAIREAWKTEKDAVEEREHPTVFLA
jgi:hypothetical protein